MKLWKVVTCVELLIEDNFLFKKSYHAEWFAHTMKYIYAETKEDAENKYRRIYCKESTNEWNKNRLKPFVFIYTNCSADMTFNLSFNQKIINAEESIMVTDLVKENIIKVLYNTDAQDFRDWIVNGETTTAELRTILETL